MNELLAEPWHNAKNSIELGELTARWLEGTLAFHPCYGDSADEETGSIQKYLIQFNWNGFITTFSQPAGVRREGNALILVIFKYLQISF